MNDPRSILAIVFFVISLTLGFFADQYHSSWVEAEKKITQLEGEQSQLKTSADSCSKKVEELSTATTKKEEDIKHAQRQAYLLAKNNEALAQSLLGAKPEDVDSCKAAIKLFQDYKTKKETK